MATSSPILRSPKSALSMSPLSRSGSSPRSLSPGKVSFHAPAAPETVESAHLRTYIDAQLTINSLILLGFDSDEYIQTYSGIAYDLIPLNRETFDHSGDKMLLITLHYLLCILDPEHFLREIKPCWPYLDHKERNAFKHATNRSIRRLIDLSLLDKDVYQASYLNNSNKQRTWKLLRALTDACLDAMLPAASPTEEQPDEDKESLLQQLEAQLHSVTGMMSQQQDVTEEYRCYLQELLQRLQVANKALAKQAEEEASRQSNNINHTSNVRNKRKVLGPQGQKIRREKLMRIHEQRQLLQSFLEAPLLGNVEKFLQLDEEQIKEKGGKKTEKRALRKAKTMTKEAFEEYKNTMRDCIGQLISNIDTVCDLI